MERGATESHRQTQETCVFSVFCWWTFAGQRSWCVSRSLCVSRPPGGKINENKWVWLRSAAFSSFRKDSDTSLLRITKPPSCYLLLKTLLLSYNYFLPHSEPCVIMNSVQECLKRTHFNSVYIKFTSWLNWSSLIFLKYVYSWSGLLSLISECVLIWMLGNSTPIFVPMQI